MELTLSAPLTAWAGKGAKTPDPATTAMEAAVPMVWVMKSRRLLLLLSLLLLLCFSLVVANRAVTVLAWVECCCGVVNADAELVDTATANERRQKDAESFMMLWWITTRCRNVVLFLQQPLLYLRGAKETIDVREEIRSIDLAASLQKIFLDTVRSYKLTSQTFSRPPMEITNPMQYKYSTTTVDSKVGPWHHQSQSVVVVATNQQTYIRFFSLVFVLYVVCPIVSLIRWSWCRSLRSVCREEYANPTTKKARQVWCVKRLWHHSLGRWKDSYRVVRVKVLDSIDRTIRLLIFKSSADVSSREKVRQLPSIKNKSIIIINQQQFIQPCIHSIITHLSSARQQHPSINHHHKIIYWLAAWLEVYHPSSSNIFRPETVVAVAAAK